MVKILAGEKGEGKTKKMIAMANEAGKTASGSIVFVDDDNSHMYDLHYSVRFVDTPEFIMQDPRGGGSWSEGGLAGASKDGSAAGPCMGRSIS